MAHSSEAEQLAELELEKLKKQIRKLQNEVRSLCREKNLSEKHQTNLIQILQKENDFLNSEITVLEKGHFFQKQNEDEQRLFLVEYRQHEVHKFVEEQQKRLHDLEQHIKKVQNKLDDIKKNEVTDICYQENEEKIQKAIKKLENKLDVASKKCNACLSENSKLRKVIDDMLQDRSQFNDIWQSLIIQFNNGKKCIMDLIDQSTAAYDQREELCIKLQNLQEKRHTEKMVHIQEMRELQRKIEYNTKLREFYNTKSQKRINTEIEVREAEKIKQQKEELEKKLINYKSLLAQIKAISCGFEEKLAATFINRGEENFALFNYVNELNHEVELLNNAVQHLNTEKEKQRYQKTENLQKNIKDNKENLNNFKAELHAKYEEKCAHGIHLDEKLNQLLLGTQTLLTLLGGSETPVLKIFETAIMCPNSYNLNLFLGIIGKKVDDLLKGIDFKSLSNNTLAKRDRIPKFNIKENI